MHSEPSHLLNSRDRLEALRRAPAYQQDFEQWKQLADKLKEAPKAKTRLLQQLKSREGDMRRKWKIQSPFPPPVGNGATNKFLGIIEDAGKVGDPPVRGDRGMGVPHREWNPFTEHKLCVLNPTDRRQTIIGQAFEGYDPIRLTYDYVAAKQGQLKRSWNKGRHLCFIVDLTATQEELLEGFEDCLKRYRSLGPKRKSRSKPTTEIKDIWQVYDQIKSGKTLSEVSQPLVSTKRTDLSVANPVQAASRATSRAFRKAEQLIKWVEDHANR